MAIEGECRGRQSRTESKSGKWVLTSAITGSVLKLLLLQCFRSICSSIEPGLATRWGRALNGLPGSKISYFRHWCKPESAYARTSSLFEILFELSYLPFGNPIPSFLRFAPGFLPPTIKYRFVLGTLANSSWLPQGFRLLCVRHIAIPLTQRAVWDESLPKKKKKSTSNHIMERE